MIAQTFERLNSTKDVGSPKGRRCTQVANTSETGQRHTADPEGLSKFCGLLNCPKFDSRRVHRPYRLGQFTVNIHQPGVRFAGEESADAQEGEAE